MLGSYQTVELIDTFVNYHESIKKCVCLVYDPQRSARGTTALRAIRLTAGFIEAYKVFFCLFGCLCLSVSRVCLSVCGFVAVVWWSLQTQNKQTKKHSPKQQKTDTPPK